jgi:hypothetical protein
MTTSEYNGRALIAIAYLPLLKLKCLVHLKFETVGIQNNNCLRLHICSTESIINFLAQAFDGARSSRDSRALINGPSLHL